MMYALITSSWYFLDLRCSLRADRKRVVDLLAAILCRRTWVAIFSLARATDTAAVRVFLHSRHAGNAVGQ